MIFWPQKFTVVASDDGFQHVEIRLENLQKNVLTRNADSGKVAESL